MKTATFPERLSDCLARLHLKQADLLALMQHYCEEAAIRMNRSDLSQYLSGKTTPSADKLYVLAAALDVDMAWLLGYSVPMRKEVTVASVDEIPGVMPVTEEERRLIGFYRNAEETYRTVAKDILSAHQITGEI